jgi:hypothetical protein
MDGQPDAPSRCRRPTLRPTLGDRAIATEESASRPHPFAGLGRRRIEGHRTRVRRSRRAPSIERKRGVAMKTVMVRYKTTEAHARANEELVRSVFDELRSRAPRGLRYATYRLGDGVTFVHIAAVETPDDNPLTNLASFKAFQAQLKERCVEPPVVVELSPVDSYGFDG